MSKKSDHRDAEAEESQQHEEPPAEEAKQYQDQRLAEHQQRAADAGANPQQAADQQQRQQHHASPAIGEIVLYREAGVISAAIVVGANPDDSVALHVFHRTGVVGTSEFDKAVEAVEGVDGWMVRPRT